TISAPQPTTILQSIAATALDTTALRIGGLRTHKHLSRRQARRAGIRITFTAPHGTGFVQVRLYRTTRSHRAGHEISRTLVNATGAQQHAILRAPRLTPGVYVLELRPAVSATQLGQATTTRLRITPYASKAEARKGEALRGAARGITGAAPGIGPGSPAS